MSQIKEAPVTVEYIEHMGSDLSVVNAARQSFSKQKTEFDYTEGSEDIRLVNFLATGMRTKEWNEFLTEICDLASGNDPLALKNALLAYKRKAVHFAPFAHPHATLSLRIPIFLARQLVKHQIGGTWSEESRRYMDSEVEYYFEPVLHGRPDDVKQGSADAAHPNNIEALHAMQKITKISNSLYVGLLTLKIAPEEAREILTLNSMTGITWTGSLLFWSRVVTQRVDPHAQKAAQHVARKIDAILRPLYPESWQALVGTLPTE